ncbi:amidase [Anatilimnocola floriformis]|uniref:amidase n=1 Tax=Anatilimnocola floriformis TaxID=2948575 RepID=UPI0020C439FC|nr:amidase family protein [Anatilimnocola floriformis]
MGDGDSPTSWSASDIARRIAAREISAREVCEAYISRCEQTHKALNALVWNRFDAARQEATAVDEKIARGEKLGPLAGVPMTIKESMYLQGSPTCIGLTNLRDNIVGETGVLVARLQRAGAIILGKTNVPQLMFWHECDNPVYGRTNNPWDLARTSGGSTGGEGAIIAAGGSPLGLGTDLGGSIRVPSAWCGIHGLKPTSRRLPTSGALRTFRGLEAIQVVAGPMARHVEDLELALQVLADHSDGLSLNEIEPWPLRASREVDIRKLKVGLWLSDDWVPPSPAIRRAVLDAAEVLCSEYDVEIAVLDDVVKAAEPRFTNGKEILELYCQLLEADGNADVRKLAKGSRLDSRVSKMLLLGGLRSPVRAVVRSFCWLLGQRLMYQLIGASRPQSTAEHWERVYEQQQFIRGFAALLDEQQIDVILSPAFGVPAAQHGKPFDLLPAASYTFLPNLLGWPAGVVSLSTVREDEQVGRAPTRDMVLKQAAAVDAGSAGLPVSVQVIARPWREDIVLAVMAALERALPRPQLSAAHLAAMGARSS